MSYLICISICLAAGVLGSLATMPEIAGWYAGIRKPSWNPPNGVFGPVWTVLYIMMGAAAARVWQKRKVSGAGRALVFFAVQLLLNTAWSFLFFRFHLLGAAFAEIVALWAMVGVTARAFFAVDRPAGWLMVPYLTWVSFASVLCWAVWRLNS